MDELETAAIDPEDWEKTPMCIIEGGFILSKSLQDAESYWQERQDNFAATYNYYLSHCYPLSKIKLIIPLHSN